MEIPDQQSWPPVTIALCGDVMTGRGVDQVLPYPSDPMLHEPWIKDARQYVELAEQANGPIPKPVDFRYVWGDILDEWDRVDPDMRIINLETSITKSNDYWKGKQIHYRMNPGNIDCFTRAKIDVCTLANNHVLDWGHAGLRETLQSLQAVGLQYTGAGGNIGEAAAPVIRQLPDRGRVLVFSFGSETSGIPRGWAAKEDRSGINLLEDLSPDDIRSIQRTVSEEKQFGDIVIASIHWGPNWGYQIPPDQREFAHGLIDHAGVDVVYGHSSHHVKAVEVYGGRLILYGCGDFLDDYEGISGYEQFRDDLGLMYFASIDPSTGQLVRLEMTPTQIHRLRIRDAEKPDVLWLQNVLNREGREFGTRVELTENDRLVLA